MEPKRTDSTGERLVDGVEHGVGEVRRVVGDAGKALDRDAHVVGRDAATEARDLGHGIEGEVQHLGHAAGDLGTTVRNASHETLAPGESVTVVPSGEVEVVDVTSGAETVGRGGATTTSVPAAAQPVIGGDEGRDWLSMSTDNTAAGRTGDISNTGPIDLVVPGMRVIDATGAELGKVDDIKMGDPAAVTTQGEEYDDGNLLDDIGRAVFGGTALPEQIRNNLLRVGYLRVDGRGLFDTDYFVAADQIARVEGDSVHLTLAKDALPTT